VIQNAVKCCLNVIHVLKDILLREGKMRDAISTHSKGSIKIHLRIALWRMDGTD
jgi:hypothetical protein